MFYSHCQILLGGLREGGSGGPGMWHTQGEERCVHHFGESKGKSPLGRILYRVSQEECEILRESVPYVKLYRYNPKHLYPKLNGYGDNGKGSLKL